MQEFPHHYRVGTHVAGTDAAVVLTGDGLPDLSTAPPGEFGGPGDHWSPETLLVGAVCDCFVLGFKAIAAASRLTWSALDVQVSGTLDRIDRKMLFTHFVVTARLTVPAGQESRAPRILEKAEEVCLITNSLSAEVRLESEVVIG
jgi:organic hydroperoxide reductase OsmC/OhrA